ncbi:high mobility group box domain-containing protein, partial [Dichomitus squalens]
RPENAFILFRRKKCEERQAAQEDDDGASGPVKKQRQADLSKTISQQWKSLPPEERQYWEDLAKEKKKEHEAMYPNYVYRP